MTLKKGLDRKDRKILDLLQQDSRLSYRQIAGLLEVSVSTVSERVRKMQESRVIKGFTVLLDSDELGLDCSITALVKVLPRYDPAGVGSKIAGMEKTCFVYQVTGEFHLLVIIRTGAKHSARELLERIGKIRGVESVNSSWILQTLKESPIKIACLEED